MTLRLHPLVADNMVVQRDEPFAVRGSAEPGARVAIEFAGRRASAVAGADGAFSVELAPLSAGGPHAMTVAALGERIEIRDVLVGEVWLASGQSNMGFTLDGAVNAEAEIAAADHPAVRMFTVPQATRPTPQGECGGAWRVSTPANAPGFSAVGYFFARELNRALEVPVGIVNSSVGGTPAEAWTPLEALRAERSLASLVEAGERYRDSDDAAAEPPGPYDDPGIAAHASLWGAVDLACDDWKPMELPRMWQHEGLEFNGAIWFRKEVELPASWAGRDLVLSLDAIDDFDDTYVNGVRVGATATETAGWWMHPRVYPVPGRLVRAGRNVIAVRVFDHWCNGGFAGQAARMHLGPADGSAERVPLAGTWRYKVELELPWRMGPGTHPSSLYNGMIAPLVGYPLRGFIWYQGESNVDRAFQYHTLFRRMIRSWREAWGGGEKPFLFVQLANHTPQADEPAESPWAELREAQAHALAEPRTGMAVAIDIGEAEDIHPKNKQDVGLRLALVAERLTYGMDVAARGPTYAGHTVEGASVRVRFENARVLACRGRALQGFAVAGTDRRFVWADARIDGQNVIVRSARVPRPVAVRYAWANNPRATLFNAMGLPAEPFRTDTWPLITARPHER